MADYHVGTGEISGEIYAGTLSKDKTKWQSRTLVTDEAVCAVRDHLLNKLAAEKLKQYGYEWTRKDGKKVTLQVSIE